MAAVVMDPPLEVECGATLTLSFIYHQLELDVDGEVVIDEDTGEPVLGDPQPLDGCLVRMQVRKKARDPVVLMYGDSSAYDEDDSPQGGRIILEALDEDDQPQVGRVDVIFTDLDTMALQDTSTLVNPAYFDMECEYELQSGEIRPFVERMLEGPVLVEPNTTRTEA